MTSFKGLWVVRCLVDGGILTVRVGEAGLSLSVWIGLSDIAAAKLVQSIEFHARTSSTNPSMQSRWERPSTIHSLTGLTALYASVRR
jgi:hypothetical protein